MVFNQALSLAATYKIKEVVPNLIRLIKKQEFLGADIANKVSIVRALGQIADHQVLETWRELINRKSILFKKMSDQLKEEIYKTLKNYPYELVQDLVKIGVESSNDVIREESLRLRNEHAR